MHAEVVVMGGGAAGIGVTASLLRRYPSLEIVIVEPSDWHYYQPGWTLVGGGIFDARRTVRPMREVIPARARWIQAAVSALQPGQKQLVLDNGQTLAYQQLIVCPGLQLCWDQIEGLEATLGQNGVTSNYAYELAPYTWELTRNLRQGRAIFTQPPMPIKCAGAPQKAMYLSSDYWLHSGVLDNIEVEFDLAAPVLFGVPDFVPALMEYVEKYRIQLAFQSRLVAVDGPGRVARFEVTGADGQSGYQEKTFDMLHVVPPQQAPGVIRSSPLANEAGWCDADPHTLQHPRYPDIFSLGDVCGTSNGKTAAAARKQIVVVAENLLAMRAGREFPGCYNGYGGCPLTVERGRVLLAEFGYGGTLLPTFPVDPCTANRAAWWLKRSFMPWLYWHVMLKGREWLAGCS